MIKIDVVICMTLWLYNKVLSSYESAQTSKFENVDGLSCSLIPGGILPLADANIEEQAHFKIRISVKFTHLAVNIVIS